MSQRVSNGLSWLLLATVFLVLLLLMVLRLGFPYIPHYKNEITQFLSNKSGLSVQVDSFTTEWRGAYPSISISGLELLAPESPRPVSDSLPGTTSSFRPSEPLRSLNATNIDVTFDLFRSALFWQPVFKHIEVNGIAVDLEKPEDGWYKKSVIKDNLNSESSSSASLAQLSSLIMIQPHMSIHEAQVNIHLPQGGLQRITPINLEVNNTRSQHQITGSIALEQSGLPTSHARFVIEAEKLPEESPLSGEYQVYAQLNDFGPQLLDLHLLPLPVSVSELDAGVEVWASFSGYKLSKLQGDISLKTLRFDDETLDDFVDSRVRFSALPLSSNRYQLQLSGIELNSHYPSLQSVRFPNVTALFRWMDTGEDVDNKSLFIEQVAVSEIDLDGVTSWLKGKPYLTEPVDKALSLLDPKGRLNNLVVNWPEDAVLSDFNAVADLSGVSVDEYFGSPQVTNVNGQLVLSKEGGHVDLDSTDFGLFFPSVFEGGWHYAHAQGRVKWEITQRDGYELPVVIVNSGILSLIEEAPQIAAQGESGDGIQPVSKGMQAFGRFRLMLPIEKEHQSEFSLVIGLENGSADLAAAYVPPKEAGAELHAWIKKAVKSGVVKHGMLVLRTDTRQLEERNPPTVQLYLDIEQGEIEFLDKWPTVSDANVSVWLDHQGLRIKSDQARIMNSQGTVDIVSTPDVSQLEIRTNLSGEASDIQTILLAPQVRAIVGDGLDDWRISGAQATQVKVDLALKEEKPPAVDVISELSNAGFQDKAKTLSFDKINGTLKFSTQQGLSAKGLRSRFLGAPVIGNVETIAATGESPSLTRVTLTGKVASEVVQKWTGLSFLNSVLGEATVNGRMDICAGSPLCNKLVVNSDLVGVELDLPAPLGKPAGQPKPLQLVGQLGIDDPVWRYNLNDQLRGVTKLMGRESGTRVFLGDVRPKEPTEPGIWVEGHQASVDVRELFQLLERNEWIRATDNSAPSEQVEEMKSSPITVSLMIDKITVGTVVIPDVDLVYHSKASGTANVGIISPLMTGDIKIPADPTADYRVSLKHLRLEAAPTAKGQAQKDDVSLGVIDTKGWPNVSIVIDKLLWNDQDFGRWSARVHPDQTGQLTAESIEAVIASYKLQGEAGWRMLDQQPRGYLDLSFTGGDLGKVIGMWGYENVLESKKGDIQAHLSWPGYLWDFSSKGLDGNFLMDLKDGRIVESGESANILRLFGILNLNTIVRRLKLNFSDLVDKGVAYDTLKASFLLKQGTAYTNTPLKLEGPSADLELTGSLDLPAQTIDAKMNVVLPFTSNVPIAAVLLGAPQIAGAVFLIDKLIGDKIEKVTSLTYEVKGPWSEPNVGTLSSKPEEDRNDPFRMDRNDK